MKLIKYDQESDQKGIVTFIHHMPFDEVHGLPEEILATGVLIETIPEPEQNGKIPQLFINPETKELWYEYEDRPLTAEEKVEQLEQQLIAVTALLNMLLLPPEL